MTLLSGTVRDGQNHLEQISLYFSVGRVGHTQTMCPSARPERAPLFSGSTIYGSTAPLHDWLLLQSDDSVAGAVCRER